MSYIFWKKRQRSIHLIEKSAYLPTYLPTYLPQRTPLTSDPGDLSLLRHLIKVMRKNDLTTKSKQVFSEHVFCEVYASSKICKFILGEPERRRPEPTGVTWGWAGGNPYGGFCQVLPWYEAAWCTGETAALFSTFAANHFVRSLKRYRYFEERLNYIMWWYFGELRIPQSLATTKTNFVAGDGKAKNGGQREESCRRETETGLRTLFMNKTWHLA